MCIRFTNWCELLNIGNRNQRPNGWMTIHGKLEKNIKNENTKIKKKGYNLRKIRKKKQK